MRLYALYCCWKGLKSMDKVKAKCWMVSIPVNSMMLMYSARSCRREIKKVTKEKERESWRVERMCLDDSVFAWFQAMELVVDARWCRTENEHLSWWMTAAFRFKSTAIISRILLVPHETAAMSASNRYIVVPSIPAVDCRSSQSQLHLHWMDRIYKSDMDWVKSESLCCSNQMYQEHIKEVGSQ